MQIANSRGDARNIPRPDRRKVISPMTNCTRTRKTCRLGTPLDDILWSRTQDQAASFAAAEEAAKVLRTQADTIRADYSFLLAEDLCFFRADGAAVQAAMAVIGVDDAVIVICNTEGASDVWTVQGMRPFAPYPATAYIAAVQACVEARRAGRY